MMSYFPDGNHDINPPMHMYEHPLAGR